MILIRQTDTVCTVTTGITGRIVFCDWQWQGPSDTFSVRCSILTVWGLQNQSTPLELIFLLQSDSDRMRDRARPYNMTAGRWEHRSAMFISVQYCAEFTRILFRVQWSVVQSTLEYCLQFSRVLCRVQCCSVSCKQVDRQAAGPRVSDSRLVTALDGGGDQDNWQWGGHGKKINNRPFNVFMHLYIVFFVCQYLWQKYML